MSNRIRVYDLARELGLANKELLDLLAEEGLEVKSHASTIDEEYVDLVRDRVIRERQRADEELEQQVASSPVDVIDVLEEAAEEAADDGREVHLKPPVIVRDLAEALGKKPNELVGELMSLNVFAAINQVVENDVVEMICARNGYQFVPERRTRGKKKAKTDGGLPVQELDERVVPRPPVVAFLGHVDHGKTSLLDCIRKTRVAAGEAGGITQHIGASVIRAAGQTITFLDTPGHEAFTAMRARGANSTDIAVLVVAADDGPMPQTIEAINHVKAANVALIVALNKIDLPSAKPDQVLVQLQRNGVMTEDWGGEIGCVKVSAMTGDGIDELLERILLESEMLELRANPERLCEGIVIEAQLESGMGPTANVLVRNGSLRVGDPILCGAYYGRIKALLDHRGKRIKIAGPSTPVKVLGLSGVPEAGDKILGVEDEKDARRLAEERAQEERQDDLAVSRKANLEDLFRQMAEEERDELKIIVKGDVRGSVEAIIESLLKIPSEKIRLNFIHTGVGEITENDVLLAAASDAVVVGFHVRAMPGINRVAKQEGVEIRLYSIIYELLTDIEEAMRGRLAPEKREIALGKAEILQIFRTSSSGKICGCMVQEGLIRVKANARVKREGEIIYNGQVVSLRRFQDDVREVRAGMECGIRLDNFEDFEVGDEIDVSMSEEFKAEL